MGGLTQKQLEALELGRKKGLIRKRPLGIKYKIKAENRGWFKKGHIPWDAGTKGLIIPWNKGKKGLIKANSGSFRKGQVPWNKNKEWKEIQNEKNHNWKGENADYSSKHSWVYRRLGKPSLCAICRNSKSKRFMWHSISGKYRRELTDWVRTCAICHNNLHKSWLKRRTFNNQYTINK